MITDSREQQAEEDNENIFKAGQKKNKFLVEKKEESTKSEESAMIGKKTEREGKN